MSKSLKVTLVAISMIAGLGLLHVWQNVGWRNIGLGNLGLGGANKVAEAKKFRVGFLPVT